MTFRPNPGKGKHTQVYEKAATARRAGDEEKGSEEDTFEIVTYDTVTAMVANNTTRETSFITTQSLDKAKTKATKRKLPPTTFRRQKNTDPGIGRSAEIELG